MKSKKILLIDLGVPFGGVETYLVNLAKILHGQVELFAVCVNTKLAAALQNEGVRVLPQRGMTNRGKLVNILTATLLMIWGRLRYGITTVWVNGYSEIVLLPVAKLLGAQAVATRHLTLESHREDWRNNPGRIVALWLYYMFAFTADRIFCVSRRVFRDIVKIVDARKVTVILNWVPEVSPECVPPDRDKSRIDLLFVGRLEKYKGASLILEAMRGLDFPVSVTIVGEGPYKSEMQEMAVGLDVHFAGFHKDTRKFYSETDIFINPSVGPEGLPLVSLEAMSFGLPCILSDLDVHKEISGNGESAALFTIGDASDLRMRIAELTADLQMRARFGRQARAAIIARHSPQVARNAYLEQLESLGKAA
jgi:glycosyltransferase involved in cell wall biosynthesis